MIKSIDDLIPYDTKVYNCIINTFAEFTEFVIYKHDFKVTTGNFGGIDEITGEMFIKGLNADRSRKFENIDGVLTPIKDCVKIENVKRTIVNSRKRALDNLFGYILCNSWKYFITLTFSPEFVDREDEDAIKYNWAKFRQKLQYYFPDVKIIAVPERHPKSGKLHIHALVGDCDLKKWLTRAINPHTNKPIFSKGRAVYNLGLFEFGFSTLVHCDENSLRVANYIIKYIIKDFGNIGYNKKTYFRTKNLLFKNKEFANLDDRCKKLAFSFEENEFTTKYKETDELIIYRQYMPFH